MIVFLNGRFVPEEQALVSVFDRSFLYGDGLFETMFVANSVPFRWGQHLERLERGAAFLGIALPFSERDLKAAAEQLILKNGMVNGLLRLTLSRGVGRRGYSPLGADSPNLVLTLHPAPNLDPSVLQKWRLHTASLRLPAGEPLAQFKTCNKLAQILARAQADGTGAEEALLLNTDGFIVEGASSNLFWIQHDIVCTPPLASGVLSGVTRLVVLELCRKMALKVQETNITGKGLLEATGVFLSLSSYGVVEGASLDGKPLRTSAITESLMRAYVDEVVNETLPIKC